MNEKRSSVSRRIGAFAAWLALLLAPVPQASADLYMKNKETSSTQAGSSVREIWIGDEAVRVDGDGQTIIMRTDENVLLVVMHAQKQVMKTPIGAAGALAQGFMGTMQIKVTPTDETRRISQWMARKYVQTMTSSMGNTRSEVWTTKDVDLDDWGKMKKLAAATLMSTAGGGGAAYDQIEAELAKMEGVPVLTQTTAQMMGMKVVSTSELLEIGERAVPAGHYHPPTGYRTVSMGDMMGGGAAPVPAAVAPQREIIAPPRRAVAPPSAPVQPPAAPAQAVPLAPAAVAETTDLPQPAAAETGRIGDVVHTLDSVEVVPVIPADWTIERFRRIAKPFQPPDNHVWYVLKGSARNLGNRDKSLKIISLVIEDADGKVYKASTQTSRYQEHETSLTFQKIEPGGSANWIGFFPVPITAKGLTLRGNDLSFGGQEYVRFPLPEPSIAAPARAGPAAPAVAQSPVPGSAQTERVSAPVIPDPAPAERVSAPVIPDPAPAVAQSAAAAQPVAAAGGPTVPLQRVDDAALGASLLLPTGATSVRQLPTSRSWQLQPPGDSVGYSLQLSREWTAQDLSAAVEVATMKGAEVAAAKRIHGGILVVTKPRGVVQSVWMFRDDAKGGLSANCSGRADQLRTLLYMCMSLESSG